MGSLDWPVLHQKILYLAYLNWSLQHLFLIPFIQTTFSLFFVLQLRQSSCSISRRDRITATTRCIMYCASTPEQTVCRMLPELPALTEDMDKITGLRG